MPFNPKKQHQIGRVSETGSGFVAVIVNEWEGKEPTIDFRRFYINSSGEEAPTQKGFSIPAKIALLDDMLDALEDAKTLLEKLASKKKTAKKEEVVTKLKKKVKKERS